MSTPRCDNCASHTSGNGTRHELPAGERCLTRFATALFNAWNSNGIDFVVLRNYERLPEQVDNDLDLLVPRAQFTFAERVLIGAAREAGYTLHNRAAFGPLCLFFHDPQTLDQIQVDLFASVAFRLLHLLPAREVLDRRKQGPLFATPDPVDEAVVNLLTRLLYHGRVKEKYKPGVVRVFRASADVARSRLTRQFPAADAELIVEAVQAEDWSAVEDRVSHLRRCLFVSHLRRQPWALCRSAVRDVVRLAWRWIQTPGLSVAVLGPDGCGKSTVIPKVVERLRHTFSPDKGLLIHWKPEVFFRGRRQRRNPVPDPHFKPPRNAFGSLAYLGFHWAEFLLGAWLQIRPACFRNGLVLMDRHYYDFLVDPRRYRLNLPHGIIRLGAAMLPKPDLVFLLDAPTEVLQSRKQEVPPAETTRQRSEFLSLIKSLPNGHVLDACQSPDDLAASIVQTVLDHLAARTASRNAPR